MRGPGGPHPPIPNKLKLNLQFPFMLLNLLIQTPVFDTDTVIQKEQKIEKFRLEACSYRTEVPTTDEAHDL